MQHKNNFLYERFLASIAVFLLFFTINATPAQTALPAEDIAEKALAATVYLEMKDRNGKTLGFGSGFFVKSNLIATNYHVIEGAARGTAKLIDKHTTYNIEGTTATDKMNDLAILKVAAYGIKPLSLGDSDAVRVGETVYVAGNPKGLEGTLSNGIISSLRDKDTKGRLQMTAPISPGSSGGPVLNYKGEVIGISFMTIEGGQNLNFAIPSKYLKALLPRSRTAKPLAQRNYSVPAETYFLRGNMMYTLQLYQEAVVEFNQALRLKPDYVDAYNNLGNAKAGLGQHFAAIADYDTAIRLKPDYALAYYNRGNMKTNLGQHFTAITDYDTAIRLKPDYVDAYNNRGLLKSKLGQHFAAIADFDMAIRLKPDYALAYYNRGLERYKLGQHFAAITDFDTAIRLKPDYVDAYNDRGNAKANLGQHFAAITDFDTAIRLKPDYVEAYNNRGNAKANLGQHFAAIADLDIAIRLKPDHTLAYYNRANEKYKLGQYGLAIADYNLALQLKPDFIKAYINRGSMKSLLGRSTEAKQDFQIALRLAEKISDSRLKTQIEEMLRLMK